MADDSADALSDTKCCNFICGVVEGFYGRPWTTEQRKDLFQKMKRWGMDSYVYAPKDDYKHRAYWRELYTVEEAEHLTGLISAAKAQGVAFYYALSPGLDITYSNQKEVATLKRKLEQVSQFGCTAFALLFDDIEPEMSEADKEIFQSFAHAQVSVTNEVQQHLGGGAVRFLLCPTQYCGTRAVPSVSSSEYLITLGAKLSKDIDIMWTGPKVISKVLTAACIEEITQVLRRPPVIWDNLHANDYDQKRMFLGPYTGRSPELIPLLRGVLSNPNCEYNANTVPIRTLAHWANCSVDVSTNIDSVAADIKLEKEGGGVEDEGVTVNKHVYHHRQALRSAVLDWLPEFSIEKDASGPIVKPQPVVNIAILPIIPMLNTCMSLTAPVTTATQSSAVPTLNTTHLQALAEVCTTVSAVENFNPVANPIMNSLVSASKVVTNESIPNPIQQLVTSNILMPAEILVSTIPVPIMGMKDYQDALNNTDNNIDASKMNFTSDMLEVTSNDQGSENSSVSNMPNITVMSNNQNQSMCTVSDCLEVRVSHMEEKDKVALSNSGDTGHSVIEAVKVLVSDEDSTADIIVDDCDERLENKEIQNGAMSVGESPCTMSPPHTDTDMECTPENETAAAIISSLKNSLKVDTVSPTLESPSNDIDVVMTDTNENGSMQVELSGGEIVMENNDSGDSYTEDSLNMDDLMLLCDLFYLPFEHGSQGLKLLQEFNWLKCNAPVLLASPTKDIKNCGVNKSESQEWHFRARHFATLCGHVTRLSRRLGLCRNKELSHDLCGYVWDLRAVVGLLNSYVQWLALAKFPPNIANFTQGSYTWFSKGWKEAFMSGDQEPWVFRGGLTADLQRLLPIDNGNDLLTYKLPASPTSQLCTIRPYADSDKDQLCSICHRTCRDGMDCSDQFPPELQALPADRLVAPYLSLYPELCMVVEEEAGPCGSPPVRLLGYACAAPDTKVFCRRQEREWTPTMMEKYPTHVVQEWSSHFESAKHTVPEEVSRHHPAVMSVSLLPHCCDPSAPKRLVTCLLAALRANGSFGVHVCINSTDNYMHQFYSKLGFVELTQDTTNNKIYLGRNF